MSRRRLTWRGGGDGAVAFGAALIEVADQRVGAAGVAQLSDHPQQVGDGHGGVGPARFAEVVAVGVDEGGPVGGGDAQGELRANPGGPARPRGAGG